MDTNLDTKLSPQETSDLLSRAFTFIKVARGAPDILKLLAPYGFGPSTVAEGWGLLYNVIRLDDGAPAVGIDGAAAIRELDAWDETGFELAHIALRRKHPDQHTYLFRNLEAVRGPQSVVGVKVFLDRLDELESSPARAQSRTEDQGALDALASRGIHAAERKRLRALVDIATTGPTDSELSLRGIEPKPEDVAAIAAWYDEWASTAKLVIARRDILFRLGLVKRRKPRAIEVAEPGAAPAAPAPAPITTNASNGAAVVVVP